MDKICIEKTNSIVDVINSWPCNSIFQDFHRARDIKKIYMYKKKHDPIRVIGILSRHKRARMYRLRSILDSHNSKRWKLHFPRRFTR